jgi:hypothetical protein
LITWDPVSGRTKFDVPTPNFNASRLLVSKDGAVLGIAFPKSVWFDGATGARRKEQPLGVVQQFLAARLGPDGNTLRSVSFMGDKVQELTLDSGTTSTLANFNNFSAHLGVPAFSPDLKRIACNQGFKPLIIDL